MKDYINKNTIAEYQQKDESLNLIIEKMNELFLSIRKKYITNKYVKSYITVNRSLTDNVIKSCLNHKETIAIFCPLSKSKFITFDIDVEGDLDYAEEIAIKIYDILINDLQAEDENIIVNYSGNKGLHIHLVFKSFVESRLLKNLYMYVLSELKSKHFENLTEREVEFRPTYKQAIKIPLQQHPTTKNICNLVDITNNFTVLNPYNILTKTGMDITTFKFSLEELNIPKVKHHTTFKNTFRTTFTRILNKSNDINRSNASTNIERKSVKKEPKAYFTSSSENCILMLNENKLLYPNSRHNSTISLATYLNTLGKSYEEAVETISSIISTTFKNHREYIDRNTTLEYALSEVERLTKLAYTKNYRLKNNMKSDIQIYQQEIERILLIDKKAVREIALILLMHDKKYNPLKKGRTFTLSYRQVNDILGTNKSFKNIKSAYEYLEDLGYLTIVNKEELTEQKNYKDTTKFKINFRENPVDVAEGKKYLSIYLNSVKKEFLTVDYFALQLFTEEELKKFYTKSTYHRNILPAKALVEYDKNGIYLHIKKQPTTVTINELYNLAKTSNKNENFNLEVVLNMLKKPNNEINNNNFEFFINTLDEIDLKYKLWRKNRKILGKDFIKI